jgi:serine/threonine protein kinase
LCVSNVHIETQYTHLGSLDQLLFRENQTISDERKLELAQGIARGVLHLHKHNIVHRDLAARNILLTASGDAKISVLFLFLMISLFVQQITRITSYQTNKLKLLISEMISCLLLFSGFWNITNS